MDVDGIKPAEILLVEDNPADVRLTEECLKDCKIINRLSHVSNGIDAIEYLKKRGRFTNAVTPDLIFLDLNLPQKDGREVLADIKTDPELKSIPVVVITSSKSEEDIAKSYSLHANCYIQKPIDLEQFNKVVKAIESFWFSVVQLPPKE